MPTVADLNSLVYDYLVEECKSGAKAFKKADGIVMDKAGATAAWGGRTLQAVHAEHTAGGESSSDSSSSSSSSSDSSSDSESVKAAPKAVAAKDDSDSDSDSSSDDSSSSSSSSSKPARKPSSSPVKRVVTTKLVLKKSPRNSPQIAAKIASKRKAESEAGGPKKKKVPGERFCRMDVVKVAEENQAEVAKDNRWESTKSEEELKNDFTYKAHDKLIVTKGKGFTKAKNKLKKSNYRFGEIDQTVRSFKYDSDSD